MEGHRGKVTVDIAESIFDSALRFILLGWRKWPRGKRNNHLGGPPSKNGGEGTLPFSCQDLRSRFTRNLFASSRGHR